MSYDRPDSNDDTIDSRQVIDTIAELETQALINYEERHKTDEIPDGTDLADYLDDDEDPNYYRALKALAAEAEDYAADWKYGETLIRDSYFEDWAQEFAVSIGAINRDAEWPLGYIDWKAAAEALQQDYTDVEFDGVTYWIR